MKRFWITSVLWIALVAAAVPFVVEAADRRGLGLVFPNLSVTASEVLIAALLAVGPPLAAFLWLRRKRRAG